MLAFATPKARLVDELYRAAMAGGSTCRGGGPGPRPSVWPGFYAAYVRDPDGNKISFACYNGLATKTANVAS